MNNDDYKYTKEENMDMIDYAYDLVRNISDDDMVKYFDEYRAAWQLINDHERRIKKEKIKRKKLEQKYAKKIQEAKRNGFIFGVCLTAACAFAVPQFVGGEKLADEVYTVMSENDYGWRDDSQAGIIFNQGTNYVDYDVAVSNIVRKCEERGMTDAEIDVGCRRVFGGEPCGTTMGERIDAKLNACFSNDKVEELESDNISRGK